MTDHYLDATRLLAEGRTSDALVHAVLAVAQRMGAQDVTDGSKPNLAIVRDADASLRRANGNTPKESDLLPPARFDRTIQHGEDIVQVVNHAPPGTTIMLPSGVIRGVWGLRPRDGVEIWSDGTTELRGTTVLPLHRWENAGVGRWTTAMQFRLLPDYATSDNTRDPFDPNVQPEKLYADGVALRRVVSEPQAGEWSLELSDDGHHRIATGESPADSEIEFAHSGPDGTYDLISSSAAGVVLANFTVSRYATPLYRGAIGRLSEDRDAMGPGWRLHRILVTDVSGSGICLGEGALVEHCRVQRCGQTGIRAARQSDDSVGMEPIVITETAVSGCGHLVTTAHEGGAIHVDGIPTIGRKLWLYDNPGAGWVLDNDRHAKQAGLEQSLVERNGNAGVVDRRGAAFGGRTRTYTRNVIRFNGTSIASSSSDGSGLVIHDSADVQVMDCRVYGNAGHQVVLADHGDDPGLRRVSLSDNHVAGGRPLLKLQRGRTSSHNPRAEVTGRNNHWYARREERPIALPDGRLATLDAWALETDQLADPDNTPPDAFDLDVLTQASYGPEQPAAIRSRSAS